MVKRTYCICLVAFCGTSSEATVPLVTADCIRFTLNVVVTVVPQVTFRGSRVKRTDVLLNIINKKCTYPYRKAALILSPPIMSLLIDTQPAYGRKFER